MTADSDGSKNMHMLAEEFETQLLQLYGSPILSGENLRTVLGYSSLDAFRQAMHRKTVPVPLYTMENRRGRYAYVKDVADYLATMRHKQP
ncbi:hypothetical protein J5X90_05800 [Pseudoalteromonas viridis]|uniref:Pyocin activator protein PrtN n=2 Tax=Pseudoalteromonas viridis TaxID=339617 RepID=A0ABX7VA53_9GAMM|nr:hypothetical protein J5X90_05800 [Pseudoalteromonas viridis]